MTEEAVAFFGWVTGDLELLDDFISFAGWSVELEYVPPVRTNAYCWRGSSDSVRKIDKSQVPGPELPVIPWGY